MKTLAHTIHYLRQLFRTKRTNPLHMFDYGDEWNMGRQGKRVVINIATRSGDADVTLITLTAYEAWEFANKLLDVSAEISRSKVRRVA